MNNVILVGRLTKEPEMSYTKSGKAVCKMTIAVDRGKEDADFINCVAFDRNAENIGKMFHKGRPISVIGNIRTGSYTNRDGKKVYTTDVWIDRWEFVPQDKRDEVPDTFSSAVDDIPF